MTLSRNSLKVRIVAPIFAVFTLTVVLLVFVLFNASHNVSMKTYAYIGRQQADEVRRILDTAFGDLVDARLLENRMVTEAKQRVALDEVAAVLKRSGLGGIVVDEGGRLLLGTSGEGSFSKLKPFLATEGPFHFEEGFSHYNGYVLHFPAWGWKLLLLNTPVTWVVEAYRSEFGYLMPSAAFLGLALFGLTLLVVRRNFQAPIDGMLADLDAKREIGGTGIAELDTIGDAFNESIRQEKKLYEQLLRSQKLEALGTLAGGIAHDFNNLLTAIRGYAELLSDNPGDPEATRRFAVTILNAADQGADLTRRILATTRKERMQVVPVDLNSVVRTSLGLLERSIPKSIEVAAVLDENVPGVTGDPSQLQQVIMNLAVNARDAMPGGGKLTVSTNWTDGEEFPAEGSAPPPDGYVRLCVSDTGHGMDAATRLKIFDPFFTTKETGKGTGLGLFIVHSVVANHGGKINIYSEEGQGTRFSVYLPATRETAGAEEAESGEIFGSGTILVIDDEPDILALCGDLLSTLGYDVIVAGGGAEGIALFKERGDAIALVLLDMIMPKMGGEAVFRALKAHRPDVKVLLSSGYSPDGYEGIDTLIREGVGGFISKPFSRKAIGLAIRKLLPAAPEMAGG
jgi:signal transduction histidine kinase/ActR/RegA family two-component response regulator